MENYRLLNIHVLILAILGFAFFGCSHTATLPDPETASGVYIQSGFEYYRWEEGLRLMIWHDGVNHLSCSSYTNGEYQVKCIGESIDDHTFEWRVETHDGKTAQFTIDDHPYKLVEGSVFIIESSGGDLEVKQLQRDLSEVQADANSVTEFGLSDQAILEFIQTSSGISDLMPDCVSSTIPKNDSKLSDVEAAQQALISFFSHLYGGEYEQASALYGGSYDVMREHNPEVNPDDHGALLRNTCTVNGAQCIEVRQVSLLERPSPGEFRFSVEFSNEDGSLFALGPCCGDDDQDPVEQTEFIYTVRFECSGKYYVMEAPVYLP